MSATPRAVAQRNRKATQGDEDRTLTLASDSDRSAKSSLMKKLRANGRAHDKNYVARAVEEMEEKRFREYKSGRLSRLFITS